ncbi:2,3-diaminopropionate biosynthesis protein SbnB [Micromonospora marina]|uniref:2,3-diaminopropionate biosynthesis protein SbnB n=1 Tax=Micromonospora marina TaxID=307120 RepID=UPI003D71BECD
MTDNRQTPSFTVIGAPAITQVLESAADLVVALINQAYAMHGRGETVNPTSLFFRPPGMPGSRIIALPAAVQGDAPAIGLKWISSFPGNLADGLPRASAVLVLNDPRTGFPVACLESSVISATRTAASAVLAAGYLSADRPRNRVGFVGTGLIATYVQRYLTAQGWPQQSTLVHDLDAGRARRFADRLAQAGHGDVRVRASAEDVVRSSDVVVFATTAATPYLLDPAVFAHHPLVLHLSLRDLGTAVILSSVNVVDDREHCLREHTSVHLAAMESGDASFLTATIPDVLAGSYRPRPQETVVVSPFGLGVLDIVLADFVFRETVAKGLVTVEPDFFHGAGAAALPSKPAER